MTTRKNLGMGLDALLTSVEGGSTRKRQTSTVEQARTWFDQALREEDGGNVFEAYHLYRRVIEALEPSGEPDMSLRTLASRALNNAAVILAEYEMAETARGFLKRALEVNPENTTARDNLELI
ncbi:MAG: hypothetical protein GX964_04990 [Syntrophomonadaceae bacterium]|jgi:tetratricopeptide (TPR) repeat protein|nr:hypothetical protein [Syntrophomonadaceae bacterium]